MTHPLQLHLPRGYPGIPARLQAKRYPRLPIADRTALFRNPDGSGGHPEPGETFGMALNPRSFRGRIAERYWGGLPNIWDDASVIARNPGSPDPATSEVLGDESYRIFSPTGSNTNVGVDDILEVGEPYIVELTIDSMAVPGNGIVVGNTGPAFNTVGPHVGVYFAEGANAFIKRAQGVTDIQISNVKFKRLPDAPWVAPSTEAALTLQQHPAGGVRNQLADSQNFAQFPWQTTRAALVPHAVTAPDGELAAYKIEEDGVGASYVYQSSSFISGQQYCLSAYVKADDIAEARIQTFGNSVVPSARVNFDLTQATGTPDTSTPDDYGLSDEGDGWFRCFIVFTATGTGTANIGITIPTDAVATGEGFFFWGTQLEPGSEPTPYQKVINPFWVEEDGQQPVFSGVSDGTDDTSGLEVDGTGEANSTAFLMMRTTDASGVLMHHSDGWWRGIWLAGSSTPLDAPHGDPSIYVDGIPFGPTNTRGDVANTLADGEWKFVKLPILNMMSTPGTIYVNGFTGSSNYEWLGEIADLRIVPDSELTPALEQAIEDEMRALVGQNPAYVEPWDIDGLMLYPDVSHESAVLSGLNGSGGPAQHGSTYGMIVDRADLKNQTFDEYVAGLPELLTNGTFDSDLSGWEDHSTAPGATSYDAVRGAAVLATQASGENSRLRHYANQGSGKTFLITVTAHPDNVDDVAVFFEADDLGDVTPGSTFRAIVTSEFNSNEVGIRNFATHTTAYITSVSLKEIPATIWTAPSTEGSPTLAREVPGVRRNLVENNVTQAPSNPNAPFVFATSGRPDPKGGNQAIRLQSDVSEGRTLFRFPLIEKPSTKVAITIQIKKNAEPIPDGTPGLGSDISDGGGYSYLNNGLSDAAVGEWVEFKFEATPGVGSLGWLDIALTSADWDIDVYLPQVEYGIHTTVQAVAGQFDSSEEGKRSLVYSVHDGIDDGLSTAGVVTATSGSLLYAIRTTDNQAVVLGEDGAQIASVFVSNDAVNAPEQNSGPSRHFVDGIEINQTRAAFHAAVSDGEWHIVEIQDLDFTGYETFSISYLPSYFLNGSLIGPLAYTRVLTGMDRINVYRHLRNLIGE